MRTVGIGMIGSGFMGLTYAEVVARHVAGARLAAVAGGRRAKDLAAEYGVAAESSIAALLARDDVDAVSICLPDRLHTGVAVMAAEAGKAILLEKPLAHD